MHWLSLGSHTWLFAHGVVPQLVDRQSPFRHAEPTSQVLFTHVSSVQSPLTQTCARAHIVVPHVFS